MNKHRIPAFTLMELTIAMVLAALVTIITYSAYTITSHAYQNYHRRSDNIGGIVRVNELLMKDFARADTVFRSDSGILIKRDSVWIRYQIDSSRIIRNAGRTDTFKVQLQDLSVSFDGQPVNFTSPINEADRVDELSFIVLFEKQKIPYHYIKIYSSASLIKRKAHALY